MKITSTHILIGVAIVGIGLLVGSKLISAPASETPTTTVEAGKYVDLAKCIKNAGAKFYGAFWCPHCHEQKVLFGDDAVAELPYIECSNPDKKSQTQACIDAKITGYPTWELADGTRLDGVVSLKKLGEATSCTVPE